MGDIFNVKYNEKLDRLEIPQKKSAIVTVKIYGS